MLIRFLVAVACCVVAGTPVNAAEVSTNKKDDGVIRTAETPKKRNRPARAHQNGHAHKQGKMAGHPHARKRFQYKVLFVDAAAKDTEQTGTRKSPFTSLQAALDAAGKLKKGPRQPVKILIKSGTYAPEEGKEAFELTRGTRLIAIGNVALKGALKVADKNKA